MTNYQVLSVVLLMLAGISSAGTLYVAGAGSSCTGHATIQEAVDAAVAGDLIIVCNDAEYHENLLIDKPLTIQGDGAVVHADSASSPVVAIEADNVTVSNFVLRDATGSYGLYSTASYASISNLYTTNNDIGFYLLGSSNNNLTSNTAHDNLDEGFRLSSNSDNNTLINNTAYNQPYYGFYIYRSSGNALINNSAYNSSLWYGFFIYSGAQDNALINNTAYGNAHHGFHIYMTSDNVLQGNTAFNNSADGFRISSSTNNVLDSNTAYGNLQSGFLASSDSDNLITNNNAYDNAQYGFYLHLSTDNTVQSNDASGQEGGVHIFSGSGNLLESNTANGNDLGFYLDLSSDNELVSNTAHDNAEHGFLLSSSSGNLLSSNDAHDNANYGFYIYLSPSNNITENTAYGNLNGFRMSSSPENSLYGNSAYSNDDNGIQLYSSPDSVLEGNDVYENGYSGFYLYESDGNVLLDNAARENSYYGFLVYLSSENVLEGNDAYDNLRHGFLVSSAQDNSLVDNTAHGNSLYGFHLYLSGDNHIESSSAYGNEIGTYLLRSTGTVLEGEHYYGNTADLVLNASSESADVTLLGIVFDNPSGNMEGYSNISIADVMEPDSTYAISWSDQPAALPHPYISFEGKHLDISSSTGTSIDLITWHWLESEADGYDESEFQLWQYDSAWTALNASLDNSLNTLTLSGLNPASVYSILQNRSLPSFELHNPLPGEVVNESEVTLEWTVHSYDSVSYCNITVNGEIDNPVEIVSDSQSPAGYDLSLPGEGSYQWNVTCRDSVGTNTSETWEFIMDLPPSVSLESTASEFISDSSYELDFTATDSRSPTLDCYLYINGSLDQAATAANSTPSSFVISGLDEGEHHLMVSCEDESGNTGSSETKQITIDQTPPQLELLSPEDGYFGNDVEMTFNFTSDDELSPVLNHSIYINGVLNQSSPEPIFTIGLPEGTHNWSITVTDLANNSNVSETRELTLDQSAPVITLHQPSNNQHIESSAPVDVTFRFTASDDYASAIDCTVHIDGDDHDISVMSGVSESFTDELDVGTHYWWVSCTDDAGNTRNSPDRVLTIGITDDDDDDGDDEPNIVITISQDCTSTTFDVSSGSGTYMRLLNSEGFLIESKNAGAGGISTFDITETGSYEIRATKNSYKPGSKSFYHESCSVTPEPPDVYIPDLPDPEDDEESDEVPETPVPPVDEPEPQEEEPEENDSVNPTPVVVIEVNGTAYLGEIVVVNVTVDNMPFRIPLKVTSPNGEVIKLITDSSGQTSFRASQLGRYNITVDDPDLPSTSAYIDVIERLLKTSPENGFAVLACIPLFLLLLSMFFAVTYFGLKKKKKLGYAGFRKKESIGDKVRKLLRIKS
jgi:parallel beta-helix repeat protein